MKESSVILLRDARAVLSGLITEAAENNPLVGAFCAWIKLDLHDASLLDQAVAEVAHAKGAERSSRGLAILGFYCGANSSASDHQEAFRKQLEWNIGKPNFDVAGEPSAAVVDPITFLGICVGAKTTLSDDQQAAFREWVARVVADAEKTIKSGEWQASLAPAIASRFLSISRIHEVEAPLWLRDGIFRCCFLARQEHAPRPSPKVLQIIFGSVGDPATDRNDHAPRAF
jgi:hypothetical protein